MRLYIYCFCFYSLCPTCSCVHGYSFWIGLLVPFGVIYIMNWVIFILIFASMLCRPNVRKETSNNENLYKLKKNYMIALGLSLLFGISWAFGLLTSSDIPNAMRYPAEWIFTLVNTFLGVYLFVLYIIWSPDARKVWKRLICCHYQKSVDLSHSTRRTCSSSARFLGGTFSSASGNFYSFSNPSEETSHIDLIYDEPYSVVENPTARSTPTTAEIELLPFDPDGRSNSEEAAKTVSLSKLPVKSETETNSIVETTAFDDNSYLLSFNAPSAAQRNLSHTDADCNIVENKGATNPDCTSF